MSLAYDEYLNEHIKYVNKSLQWMQDNLCGTSAFVPQVLEMAIENARRHDESKTQLDEYRAYDAYFYGGNRSYKVCQDFDRAWLLHQHRNHHHWQYWVLINDDPGEDDNGTPYKHFGSNVRALSMPLEYVYEMIADWWSFSWMNGNLFEIFGWYNAHHNYQIIHPATRCVINDILEAMWNFLIAQAVAENQDIGEIEKQYTLYFMKKNEIPFEISEEEYFQHSDEDDEKQKYGVPEQKKFPMPDAKHVRSAIKFFNWVEPRYEKELANAILARVKEYGMILGEDITVGDENRFKNYIPKKDREEE